MDILELKIENVRNITKFAHKFSLKPEIHIISGINGNGKSTIFYSLAQIIKGKSKTRTGLNQQPMRKKPQNTENAYIEYTYIDSNSDKTKQYKYTFDTKSSQWSSNIKKIKELNGLAELSVIYGTRFDLAHKTLISKIEKIANNPSNYDSLDTSWIEEQLGYILKNDENFYRKKLKIINKDKLKEKLQSMSNKDKDNQVIENAMKTLSFSEMYILENAGQFVFQHEFSTGENLLLTLLTFLNKLKSQKSHELNLMLIDEIELGLHPFAQKRLIQLLNQLTGELNLCIYISTHSLTILNTIQNLDNIFELHNDNGDCSLANNSIATIAERISHETHFDKYIFVEDDKAEMYLNVLINKLRTQNKLGTNQPETNKRFRIYKVGTASNTRNLHLQIFNDVALEKLSQDKIITVIDRDKKTESEGFLKNETEKILSTIQNIFQLDTSFYTMIQQQQNTRIKSAFEQEQPHFDILLESYNDKKHKFNKNKNDEDRELLEEAHAQIYNKSYEIIEEILNSQIAYLPVNSIEKFFWEECLKFQDANLRKFIDEIQKINKSQNQNQINELIKELNKEFPDEKDNKRAFNKFISFLKLTDEEVIEKIIFPMIELLKQNEIEDLTRKLIG